MNLAYRTARRIGTHPMTLSADALKSRASRGAGGLTDFGDPRFEAGLEQLIASLEGEDRLNGLGRVMAGTHLTNLLRQRLLLTEHLRQHPEIREEKIQRPIFIVGAPRTGTTVTHHLLSQDSGFRYPLTWECDELHPPLDPATMDHDPRIAASEKQIRRIMALAPNLDAAHPVGAWEAQECALLHAYAFHSDTFHVMFNCQGYARWLTRQDLRWVYEEEKLLLQYMQSGGLRPATSWLLKTPPHMENIDNILAVFPDARFITTYREPTEIVASGCSLAGTVFHMTEDDPDWHDHGRFMCWRTTRMLERNVELRRQFQHLADRFVDFPMQRMVTDPLSCVTEIYQHFGIELTESNRAKMSRFVDERGMANRKPHVYRADDYGLDIDELWPQLQFYRDFYGIEDTRS
ncbi:sulfotransferase family protein [Mycolicibacterium sp. ELW1]|uniref:sulfotransferase family protein n=1 Tax=Mycobacteriaceae TaxID=1762 RepID=UPI0011EBDA7F|nr:sulfotransferase [Mycobacterium sp. ELW1]QEN16762.1 sulfotransferase [Mycobacterium sp. ELW1]